MGKERERWIDCTKFIAVLAVMVDHSWGVLQLNQDIWYASFPATSLFVLISGMMSYRTGVKHQNECWLQCFWSRSKQILTAYCIASFFYVTAAEAFFDLSAYLSALTHFNAALPFYYVCLFLQLMLIAVPLERVIRSLPRSQKGYFIELLLGTGILLLSIWTTNYTNILNIHGGGGKLFGGTYLFLFFLGMIFEKHGLLSRTARSRKKSAILLCVFGLLCFLLWRFLCRDWYVFDRHLPFGEGINPPGFSLMLLSILCLFFFCGLFSLLESWSVGRWIVTGLGWLGQHTLYIFLYHQFIMNHLLNHIFLRLQTITWISIIIYYGAAVAGALALEYLLKKAGEILRIRNKEFKLE